MLTQMLSDAFFAALAAMGFAAISRPPRQVYLLVALLAAVGHSLRMMLMTPDILGVHIVTASFIAAFVIGTLAVAASPRVRVPAETCFFPALLPMIPGIYAYKCFGGVMMLIMHNEPGRFAADFYMMAHNGLIAICIILALTVGATIPVFLFKRVSFAATR